MYRLFLYKTELSISKSLTVKLLYRKKCHAIRLNMLNDFLVKIQPDDGSNVL